MSLSLKILRKLLFTAATHSRLAARISSALASSSVRETEAVLVGIRTYKESLCSPKRTLALLRRNTHRLEKGLIMRPRRRLFALDYIMETVACYEMCLHNCNSKPSFDPVELTWAHDVMQRYFAEVGSDPVVERARERFNALSRCDFPHERPFAPYVRDLSIPLRISFSDLHELALRRRSVRWFEPRPVPRELIDKAIVVAGLSPSACNRQPFEFRIFDDPELVRRVAALPGGVGGYAANIPVIAVVVGQLWHFENERDRHLIYTDSSLAIMSFLFALEVQGLSSCCINWPDIKEKEEKMANLLALGRDERPVMLVALGYPEPTAHVPYSAKKPVELLRSYNFVGSEQ